MIKSGLNVPTPDIPIPDLAVPYAAPAPAHHVDQPLLFLFQVRVADVHPNIIY